jgi:hypothetical protein
MTFGSAMFELDLVEKYDKPFGGRHHWPVARLQLTEGPSRLLAHRRDVIREPGRARDVVGCSLLRHGRFRTSGSETVRPGWSTRRSTSHRACSADRPCPSVAPATSRASSSRSRLSVEARVRAGTRRRRRASTYRRAGGTRPQTRCASRTGARSATWPATMPE